MEKIQVGQAADLIGRAAHEVFHAMLAIELEARTPFLDPTPLLKSDVVAAMGLTGDLSGYLSIHCDDAQAREFTTRLAKLERDAVVSPDVTRDVFSELANMIAGNLKNALAGDLWVESALPVVSLTPKLRMNVDGATGIVVPLEGECGIVEVELTVVGRIAC